MNGSGRFKVQFIGDAIAIYHVVYGHEMFDEAAETLFKLVQDAQRVHSDEKRFLFLDIDGYRKDVRMGRLSPMAPEKSDSLLTAIRRSRIAI